MAQLENEVDVISAEVDLALVSDIRKRMPMS